VTSGAARRAQAFYGERMHDGEPFWGGSPAADHEIVAAIVAGDPAGLAAAYDRYADALYAYCHTLLGEPADAADAVQDTFIIAAAKLGGLRDPSRLRPWLYAVSRNECRRRLRGRASSVPLDEAGEMTDSAPAVGVSAEQEELRDIVRAALAGLNPGEREIIELNLRHELDGADLADALGVPRNQAHALASRARDQFETSLGALLVARTGREYCAELAAILDGWDGQLTVLVRKRVNRHIERCDICGDRKRRELSPAMLLSMVPLVMLPAGLRNRVLRLVADSQPGAVRYRAEVTRHAEPFGQSGFPEPIDPPRPGRGKGGHGATAGVAAVALLLLLLGGGAIFAASLLHHPGHPAADTLSVDTPTPTPSPTSAATSSGPLPTPTPSHKTHPPVGLPTLATLAPPLPNPTPSPTPKPTVKPKPTPKPPPPPGTLVVSPSPAIVRLAQPPAGGPYLGTFKLTAKGGPVKFSITSQAPAGELTVSPGKGSIPSGGTITVTITAPAQPPPGATYMYMTSVTVNPGHGPSQPVTVYYPPAG
jgi:RNA polymerase sigma factor (sigma-70 family)